MPGPRERERVVRTEDGLQTKRESEIKEGNLFIASDDIQKGSMLASMRWFLG